MGSSIQCVNFDNFFKIIKTFIDRLAIKLQYKKSIQRNVVVHEEKRNYIIN